jgi:hypothetical protein
MLHETELYFFGHVTFSLNDAKATHENNATPCKNPMRF